MSGPEALSPSPMPESGKTRGQLLRHCGGRWHGHGLEDQASRRDLALFIWRRHYAPRAETPHRALAVHGRTALNGFSVEYGHYDGNSDRVESGRQGTDRHSYLLLSHAASVWPGRTPIEGQALTGRGVSGHPDVECIGLGETVGLG